MSRVKNTVRNSVIGFGSQLTVLAFSFFARTFFIRCLGTENLGFDALFSNVLNVMSIVDLGLTSAMAYALFEPLALKQYDRLVALIKYFRRIFVFIGILLLLMSLVVAPFIDFFINVDSTLDFNTVRMIFLLYAVNSFSTYFFVDMRTILTADQKDYIVISIDTCTKIITKLLQIFILVKYQSYIYYLLIEILVMLFSNIILSVAVKKCYGLKKHEYLYGLTTKEKRDLFSNISFLGLNKIAATGINSTDSIIISKLVGTVTLAIYSNYNLLMNAGYALIDKILVGCTASLGNLFVDSKKEKQIEIIYIIQFVNIFLASFMLLCELVLAQDFIYLWQGQKMLLDMPTVVIISINLYLFMSRKGLEIIMDTQGKFKNITPIKIMEMLINIVISIIGAKAIGINGVFIGTTVSVFLAYILEIYTLINNVMGMDVKKYALQQLKLSTINLMLVFLVFALNRCFSHEKIYVLIIKTIISIIGYLLMSIFIFQKDERFLVLKAYIPLCCRRFKG